MTKKKKALRGNQKAEWAAFERLQTQVDRAWQKMKADVRRRAPQSAILRDKKELLLLLGECNYMAREYARAGRRQKRR